MTLAGPRKPMQDANAGTYVAGLTPAGIVGEVRVTPAEDTVEIRGMWVSRGWMIARRVGEWALAGMGIGGLIAGELRAVVFLLAAPVLSLVTFLGPTERGGRVAYRLVAEDAAAAQRLARTLLGQRDVGAGV